MSVTPDLPRGFDRPHTRRRFLRLAGGSLAAFAAPSFLRSEAAAGATGDAASFTSRPDLQPPLVSVTTPAQGTAPGYVLVVPMETSTQQGPLIVDNAGETVWFRPLTGKHAGNLRVQKFRGRDVLTWWEGQLAKGGIGQGEYVIADSSYRDILRFGAANGYLGDLHEFTLTSRGTALITFYAEIPADLSAFGGPAQGTLVESGFQELDLLHGNQVLLEWHSSHHVPVEESYRPFDGNIWDYFHINSVGVHPDGNLVVSSRYTSTVYKVDRRSGEILWRLGGKKSDFELGPGTRFAFQHDARAHENGIVSIFDDGSYSGPSAIEDVSRAILLEVDETARTATLVRAILNPERQLTNAMGNAQVLADGGMFVGWGTKHGNGTEPSFSEHAADGTLRFAASLAGGGASYRAFRRPWVGRPLDRPAIAVTRAPDGAADVSCSWNGATEVAKWRLSGGSTQRTAKAIHTVLRNGFETRIHVPSPPAIVFVEALDSNGEALGTSRAIRT